MQDAASAGLKSMEHLICLLSHQAPQSHQVNHLDCREITDFTVSKFKQVISILNRTGHARFRRGPSNPPCFPEPAKPVIHHPTAKLIRPEIQSQQPQTVTFEFAKPKTTFEPRTEFPASQHPKESFSTSPPMSSTTSSFLSSVTGGGDGSVSNGKQGSSLLVAPTRTISAGKPPLSSSHRKRCLADHALSAGAGAKISSSGRCHCSKRR